MKKKKKVSMSIQTIVCVVAIVVGAILAVKWGTDWRSVYHPVNLSELSVNGLNNGTYVVCEISEYVGFENSDEYSHISHNLETFTYNYTYYTVKLYDGSYVECAVYDMDTLDRLEAFQNGKGEKVTFLGKIEKKRVGYNEDFFKKCGIEKKDMVSAYQITQTADNLDKNKCLIAVAIVIASIIGFARSFRVVYVEEEILNNITVENEDGSRQRVYGKKKNSTLREELENRRNLNLDYEMKVVDRKINRLEKRLGALKRESIIGLGCLAIGGLITYVFRSSSLALYGILIFVFGLTLIWKAFFNSGSKLAMTLSEVFSIDTVYRQLKHAEAQKAEITIMMGEKARNDFKLVNALGRSIDKPIVIDCAEYADAFMIKIECDKLYAVVNEDYDVDLKINTDELLHEEEYVQWGSKTKDISSILSKAPRDIFFIHFGEVDALWMVANNIEDVMLPVSVLRLHSNGNVTIENIQAGFTYGNEEVINPQSIMLNRMIECFGKVSTTAEYRLNNLAKPELVDNGEHYYYVNPEYADDEITLGIQRPIRAWLVPLQEDDVDASVCDDNVTLIPAGTKCTRLRIPRRATRTYVDASLEDGRIIRLVEDKHTTGDNDRTRLLDAAGDIVAYSVKEIVLR